jgi:hypothetical protein
LLPPLLRINIQWFYLFLLKFAFAAVVVVVVFVVGVVFIVCFLFHQLVVPFDGQLGLEEFALDEALSHFLLGILKVGMLVKLSR